MRDDIAAGRLPGIDPEKDAIFVVAAYSGAMAMAKSAQSTEPLRICVDRISRYLAQDTA